MQQQRARLVIVDVSEQNPAHAKENPESKGHHSSHICGSLPAHNVAATLWQPKNVPRTGDSLLWDGLKSTKNYKIEQQQQKQKTCVKCQGNIDRYPQEFRYNCRPLALVHSIPYYTWQLSECVHGAYSIKKKKGLHIIYTTFQDKTSNVSIPFVSVTLKNCLETLPWGGDINYGTSSQHSIPFLGDDNNS